MRNKICKILETKYARYEKSCSIQKICSALSLLSPRNLSVAVRLSEEIEKCIKIKEIKKG